MPALDAIGGPLEAASNLPGAVRAAGRAVALASIIADLVVRSAGEDVEAAPTPRTFAARSHRTAQAILARHGVIVIANAPAPPGPALVVTNHASYLDPLVVASLLPCVAVAKRETEGWPLVGVGLKALGVLFVKRGDPHASAVTLRRALRALRSGASVLNFPEGTTTDGRSVGPFQCGIFGLARIANVPIVPAAIAYDDARVPWFGGRAFLPHYSRVARTRNFVARLRFGAPFMASPGDAPAELAARARGAIAAMLPGAS